MNTPVSRQLFEKLEEKGFVCHKSDRFWMNGFSYEKKDYNPIAYQDKANVPTIADVVMWLYEKHGVWIAPIPKQKDKGLFWGVFCYDINNQEFLKSLGSNFNSHTQAYEAAIEHCLNQIL